MKPIFASDANVCPHPLNALQAVAGGNVPQPAVVCVACGAWQRALAEVVDTKPDAAPAAPATVLVVDEPVVAAPVPVVVRALVDIPPFVDVDDKLHTLKAGDIATVPAGVAELLHRRGKAAIVAEVAA
ncbi:MAG: hypothetical protein WC876_04460 [Candidatus Thermoplasmatota archaeon]